MSDLCRLCLSESFNTISLTECREGLSLYVLAMIILPVKIVQNENLPQNICNDCLRTILCAYKLRDVSINSEKYLKSTINEPEVEIKSEVVEYSSVFIESPEEQPNIQEDSEELPVSHQKRKYCKEKFISDEELDHHLSIEQDTQFSKDQIDKFTIDCYKQDRTPKASMSWRYFGNLHDENNQHIDINFNYCKLCLRRKFLTKYKKTSTTSALIFHLKSVHGVGKDVDPEPILVRKHYKQSKQRSRAEGATVCSECGKSFGSNQILRKHMQVHSGLIHRCDKCPAQFNYFEGLHRHKRCHDPNHLSRFVCDMCGNRFAEFKSLEKHIKRIHLNIPPERKHFCNFEGCSFSFITAYSLRKHMLTHTDLKPHECQYCDNAYASKGDLTKHLQKNHVGDAVYNCEFCTQSFRLKIQLREHYRVHYESSEVIHKSN